MGGGKRGHQDHQAQRQQPQINVSQYPQSQQHPSRPNNVPPLAPAGNLNLLTPGQYSSPSLALATNAGLSKSIKDSAGQAITTETSQFKPIDDDIIVTLHSYGVTSDHIEDIKRYVAGEERISNILTKYDMKDEDKEKIEKYLREAHRAECEELKDLRRQLDQLTRERTHWQNEVGDLSSKLNRARRLEPWGL